MAHLPRVLYYKRDKASGRQVPSGWTEVRTRLQHLLCEHCLATACPGEVVMAPVESGARPSAASAVCWGTDSLLAGKRKSAGKTCCKLLCDAVYLAVCACCSTVE